MGIKTSYFAGEIPLWILSYFPYISRAEQKRVYYIKVAQE